VCDGTNSECSVYYLQMAFYTHLCVEMCVCCACMLIFLKPNKS
jgi:hypothetical protein